MKTSARNAFPGVVTAVEPGAVNAEVRLAVAPGIEIVAVITRESVEDLGLAVGREAVALIKASFVVLAPGTAPLRTSARNCLGGTIVRHVRGAVNDEVGVEIAPGLMVVATLTRESAEALGFKVGEPAQCLIKAPHVILAVEA
jgi:molybdate transport system regulatory protein